jgi:hypothetical protein
MYNCFMNNIAIYMFSFVCMHTLSDQRQEEGKQKKFFFGRTLTNTLQNKPDK